MPYNLNNILPRPTHAASAAVAGQALTVTSTAATSFATTFNASTDCVLLDIQVANVWVTFDGTTPATGVALILAQGEKYTWSKAAAQQAKFVATTTTNAIIYASEFQT